MFVWICVYIMNVAHNLLNYQDPVIQYKCAMKLFSGKYSIFKTYFLFDNTELVIKWRVWIRWLDFCDVAVTKVLIYCVHETVQFLDSFFNLIRKNFAVINCEIPVSGLNLKILKFQSRLQIDCNYSHLVKVKQFKSVCIQW